MPPAAGGKGTPFLEERCSLSPGPLILFQRTLPEGNGGFSYRYYGTVQTWRLFFSHPEWVPRGAPLGGRRDLATAGSGCARSAATLEGGGTGRAALRPASTLHWLRQISYAAPSEHSRIQPLRGFSTSSRSSARRSALASSKRSTSTGWVLDARTRAQPSGKVRRIPSIWMDG